MKRRAYIAAAVMAATMAVTAVETRPVYGRLVSSARNFRQYFCDLGKSDVSTFERLVFSLVLANSKTPQAETGRQ